MLFGAPVSMKAFSHVAIGSRRSPLGNMNPFGNMCVLQGGTRLDGGTDKLSQSSASVGPVSSMCFLFVCAKKDIEPYGLSVWLVNMIVRK